MTPEYRQALKQAVDAARRQKLSSPLRRQKQLLELAPERPFCGAYGRWSSDPCRNRAKPGSPYCGWHGRSERLVDPSLLDGVMRDVGAVLSSTDLIGLERSESPLHSTEQTNAGSEPPASEKAALCVHPAHTSCKSPLSAPSPRLSLVDPASGIQGSTTVETASDGAEAASLERSGPLRGSGFATPIEAPRLL